MPASVTYRAVLTVRRETVLGVSAFLHRERIQRGTRTGAQSLTCFARAVLAIGWFLDGAGQATRRRQRDQQVGL